MNNFLRLIFFFIGLFLVTIAVTSFVDQMGTLSRDKSSYISLPEMAIKTATPDGFALPATNTSMFNTATSEAAINITVTPGGPTSTPITNPATATVGAALTQIAVVTQTVINTSTALPNTSPYYPPPYPPTPFSQLGIHIVQPGEYLYCIGRAYGVSPGAIAEVNNFPLDTILWVGQELIIPDVRWLDMSPGRICEPQFTPRYTSKPDSISNPIAGSLRSIALMTGSSPVLGRFQSVNYRIPDNRSMEDKIQALLPMATETPEPIAEMRKVEVDIPIEMHAGGSSEVQITFNPETGQIETSVTSPPGTTTAGATPTPKPNFVYVSDPLVIPAIFDKYRIFAIARLDTVGFEYSPEGDVQQEVRLGKGLTWRWSIKSQEAEPQQLIIRLRLHFEPKGDNEPRSDDEIWSKSFNIKVTKNLFESLFGSQASIYTAFTFITGAVLSIFSVWEKFRSATAAKKSP